MFNENLKKIVTDLNIKTPVTTISKNLEVSKGTVSSILKGDRKAGDEFLQKFANFYKININSLIDDYTSTTSLKNNLFKSIPFYDINISAGDIVFLDDGLLKDQEPDDWFDIPKSIDADIAFPTYGHSMSPVIANGDRVAYKFINDWSFFNYGMKYLIVTEEQRLVKYLRKHEKEGYVLLESENPDYDPIDMPLTSIRNILQVRYIGKIEM